MKRKFAKKLSLLLIFTLLVNTFSIFFFSDTSHAAKRESIGKITLIPPKGCKKIEDETPLESGRGYYSLYEKTPGRHMIVQCTEVNEQASMDDLKLVVKMTREQFNQSGEVLTEGKISTVSTGLGKGAKYTCKGLSNGKYYKTRLYALSKKDCFVLVIAFGIDEKVEKKMLKSMKLK